MSSDLFQPRNLFDLAGQQSLIQSVTESRDNLFSSGQLPTPPELRLLDKAGHINWQSLCDTNVPQLTQTVDLSRLQKLVQNLTFAKIDPEDMDRMGDAHIVKLFRLAQLSVEYLIYTQNYLSALTQSLTLKYKQAQSQTTALKDEISQVTKSNDMLCKEIKLKQKTLARYEYLLKLPAQTDQDYFKCAYCPKFFITNQYLQAHHQRTHPSLQFQHTAPSTQEAAQVVSQAVDYKQQERLVDQLRVEMQSKVAEGVRRLEQDIAKLQKQSEQVAESKPELSAVQMQLMIDEMKAYFDKVMREQNDRVREMVLAEVAK